MKYRYGLVIDSDKPIYILDVLNDIGKTLCEGKDYSFSTGSTEELDDDDDIEIPF